MLQLQLVLQQVLSVLACAVPDCIPRDNWAHPKLPSSICHSLSLLLRFPDCTAIILQMPCLQHMMCIVQTLRLLLLVCVCHYDTSVVVIVVIRHLSCDH